MKTIDVFPIAQNKIYKALEDDFYPSFLLTNFSQNVLLNASKHKGRT